MGYYVNPPDMSKEKWLQENAIYLPYRKPEVLREIVKTDKENAILVLIDNGLFTACGVIFSEKEFDAFTKEDDKRPKKYFITARENLKEVVEDFEYIDWEV